MVLVSGVFDTWSGFVEPAQSPAGPAPAPHVANVARGVELSAWSAWSSLTVSVWTTPRATVLVVTEPAAAPGASQATVMVVRPGSPPAGRPPGAAASAAQATAVPLTSTTEKPAGFTVNAASSKVKSTCVAPSVPAARTLPAVNRSGASVWPALKPVEPVAVPRGAAPMGLAWSSLSATAPKSTVARVRLATAPSETMPLNCTRTDWPPVSMVGVPEPVKRSPRALTTKKLPALGAGVPVTSSSKVKRTVVPSVPVSVAVLVLVTAAATSSGRVVAAAAPTEKGATRSASTSTARERVRKKAIVPRTTVRPGL